MGFRPLGFSRCFFLWFSAAAFVLTFLMNLLILRVGAHEFFSSHMYPFLLLSVFCQMIAKVRRDFQLRNRLLTSDTQLADYLQQAWLKNICICWEFIELFNF